MAKSQLRSKRQVSGTKYTAARKKKTRELAGLPALTLIGTIRNKVKRGLGGSTKKVLLSTENVIVDVKGKATTMKILSVVNNPANINYTRRNVITKGCIVKTEKGDVRITSRPGQSGTLFGVLV